MERERLRMDKDWKLQRYSRKDYTDLVDFPVEIVGRDGVVRRYSFEDAIRLYQRRVTFAPIRYRDMELIDAEVVHCRSRIDQLRRSFFHRFGWGTPEGDIEPLAVFGDIAGELAAFICRILRCEGRLEVHLSPVEDVQGPVGTWYVLAPGAEGGMLLYVYRFDGEEAEPTRERFFHALKKLERVTRSEGDTERLLAFHHTVDCGFIVTAKAGEFRNFESLQAEAEPADRFPTPWEETLEVIRRGDFEEAAARCREIVQDQPYHRSAYVAGAVLSTALKRFYDAEDFALIGSKYFPEDAVLRYHVGVARTRLGRHAESLPDLEFAVADTPTFGAARFLLVCALLDLGESAKAVEVLQDAAGLRIDNRRSADALRRLGQWLRWRWIMRLGAVGALVLGLIALAVGGWAGMLPVGMSAVMALASSVIFRQQLEQISARQRYDELSQGLRRVHRRVDTAKPLVS